MNFQKDRIGGTKMIIEEEQKILLGNIELKEGIAANSILKENIFANAK